MKRTGTGIRSTSVQLLVAAPLLISLVTTIGPAQGAYPGTNGRVAFETNRDGNLENYSMDPDGSDEVNLTNDPAEDTDPVWSPDGTRIAFVKASEGHDNVWVMNADGSGQTNLTPGAVTTGQANEGTNPTWSPDGTRIAYASSQGEIWAMNADGTNKVNLTDTVPSVGLEIQPAWSPDGTHIAYVRGADIWVMDADGSDQTPLTMTTGALQDEKAPDWSPDGSQIVYGKGSSVWRMNADGSGQVEVVPNSVLPAWSPDGTRIVFSSSAFGAANGPDIFTVDPDGTTYPARPPGPPIDNDPNWQPLAAPRPRPPARRPRRRPHRAPRARRARRPRPGHHHSTTTLARPHVPLDHPPTTPTTISDLCRRNLDSQRRFNAVLDAQQNEILNRNLDPRVRMFLLALLQAARAEGNAGFNRQLAANGCFTAPTDDDDDNHDAPRGPPTTTTVPAATTTTTSRRPPRRPDDDHPARTVGGLRPDSSGSAEVQRRVGRTRAGDPQPQPRPQRAGRPPRPAGGGTGQGNAEFNRLLAPEGASPRAHSRLFRR